MEESTKFKRLRKNRDALIWVLVTGFLVGVFFSMVFFIDPTGKIFGLEIIFKYLKNYFQILFMNGDDASGFAIIGLFVLIVPATCGVSIFFLVIRRYFEYIGYILAIVIGISYIALGLMILIIWPALVLPIIFFCLALLIILLAIRGIILKNESLFYFNPEKYNIPTVSDSLVVYFSDKGYARKIAHEIAANQGSEIFEMVPVINNSKKIKNKYRFVQKYASKKYGMCFDIEDVKPFEKYRKIAVVSPISKGHLAPISRFFFREYGRKISPDLEVYLEGSAVANITNIDIEIQTLTELKDYSLFRYKTFFGYNKTPKAYKLSSRIDY